METYNKMSDGSQKSVAARGMAAAAREHGNANNAPGFALHGANRQAANGIVHAPAGEARNHVNTAAQVYNNAKK
jgi:hypothetical protein